MHRLLEEFDAAHLRHPVVGDKYRHCFAAEFQLVYGVQGIGSGFGADDAIALPIVPTEIPGDCARDRRIVVDGENDRLLGLRSTLGPEWRSIQSSPTVCACVDRVADHHIDAVILEYRRPAGIVDPRCGPVPTLACQVLEFLRSGGSRFESRGEGCPEPTSRI